MSDEYIEQLVASEAIIAATAKKKDASSIISQGMDILKTLYKSKNDHIKVRALVGMCKLGSSGGHDASIKPLAEGSSEKLAEACRRFLINPEKDPFMLGVRLGYNLFVIGLHWVDHLFISYLPLLSFVPKETN